MLGSTMSHPRIQGKTDMIPLLICVFVMGVIVGIWIMLYFCTPKL